MKTIILKSIERTYKNNGQHAQQVVDFTLTNKVRKHDAIAFDIDSDIPEFHMSVKSNNFSLASGSLMKAKDLEGQIKEFFERVHSNTFAYVTKDFSMAYIMNANEFEEFLKCFSHLDYESRDKTLVKVRANQESIKMIKWFESHLD